MSKNKTPLPLKVVIVYFVFLAFSLVGPAVLGDYITCNPQHQCHSNLFLNNIMLILGIINIGVLIGLLKQNKIAFVLALLFLLYGAYGVLGGIVAFRKEDITLGSYVFWLLPMLAFFVMNIFSIIYLIRRLKSKSVTH